MWRLTVRPFVGICSLSCSANLYKNFDNSQYHVKKVVGFPLHASLYWAYIMLQYACMRSSRIPPINHCSHAVLRNGPNRIAKRPIPQSETAHSVLQNGPFSRQALSRLIGKTDCKQNTPLFFQTVSKSHPPHAVIRTARQRNAHPRHRPQQKKGCTGQK